MQRSRLLLGETAGLGPHNVNTLDARHLCTETFISATIYHPTLETKAHACIVIVSGFGCGEHSMAAWGPFYASHGIVAMTIGTPSPYKDFPAQRCQALLDAVGALQAEHTRAGSLLEGRLAVDRCAVQGWSLGGGAVLLAALEKPSLKCVIALSPHTGNDHRLLGNLTDVVPTLFLVGEKDTVSPAHTFAWPQYRNTAAPSLIFEIANGDHCAANGPSSGSFPPHMCLPCFFCNVLCAIHCKCVPFPCITMNWPTGHATKSTTPGAAVGSVALAFVKSFLLGDDQARPLLQARPEIASAFEMNEGMKRI